MEAKNLIVKINVPEKSEVFCDANHFEIIFRNLFSNAIKFSKNGQEIEVNFSNKNEKNILEIKDYGQGISKSIINALNNNKPPRSSNGTNNEKGTGLGLMIVKDLVRLNKGKLEISSSPENGTSTRIIF